MADTQAKKNRGEPKDLSLGIEDKDVGLFLVDNGKRQAAIVRRGNHPIRHTPHIDGRCVSPEIRPRGTGFLRARLHASKRGDHQAPKKPFEIVQQHPR